VCHLDQQRLAVAAPLYLLKEGVILRRCAERIWTKVMTRQVKDRHCIALKEGILAARQLA